MANPVPKRAIVDNNNPGDPLSDIKAQDVLDSYTDIESINDEIKMFGFRSLGSSLITGVIGYYGGFLPDGTEIMDGFVTLTGTVDKYVYLMPDSTIDQAEFADIPAGAFIMFKVPYSGGSWQLPELYKGWAGLHGGVLLAGAGETATIEERLNQVIGAGGPTINNPSGSALSDYGDYEGDDSGWTGTKTDCIVFDLPGDPLDGYLIPESTTFLDDGLFLDNGETLDNYVTSYTYRTLPYDFGAVFFVQGSFTITGSFPYGDPVITGEYSNDSGATWLPLTGAQVGLVYTFEPVQVDQVRFTSVMTQDAADSPSYVSGFSMAFQGPQYGETYALDIPIEGLTFNFTRTYPVIPAVEFFPYYMADQRLRADVSEPTLTSVFIQLVMDDGVGDPMNGRGKLTVSVG